MTNEEKLQEIKDYFMDEVWSNIGFKPQDVWSWFEENFDLIIKDK